MADRTSAALFNELFGLLIAEVEPGPVRDKLAKRLWEMSRHYDFSDSQLECDDDLIELGLAHLGVDPKHPEEGPVTVYEPPPTREADAKGDTVAGRHSDG